jgi:hypothetical protein
MPTTRNSIARWELDRLIENGPDYLRPIWLALRDDRIPLVVVSHEHEKQPIDWPHGRPCILIICDDLDSSLGPVGFHRASLHRFIKGCGKAVIVACEPLPIAYLSAATTAITMKQSAIIVETIPSQEAAWIDFIETYKPQIHMVIATVKPGGGTN